MKKLIFIADGKVQDFYFNFSFFMKSDVVIEVNSVPATKYNLICTSDGLNADFPFVGGRVHFAKPPKQGDVITIYRNLPIKRIVDYQPTTPYNPTTLNHDLNYLIEIVKDLREALDACDGSGTDTDNTEMVAAIMQSIGQITIAIDAINGRIDNLDISDQPGETVDLSEINSSISSLSTAVNALDARCNQLAAQIESAPTPSLPENIDYVVEWQTPTAENNYTWYRKYASGWVEQGGLALTNYAEATPITMPIEMTDSNYTIFFQGCTLVDGYGSAQWHILLVNSAKSPKTATKFYAQGSIAGYELPFSWQVQGMSAN